MVVRSFPPVESADEDGLLAVGGDLDPETLVEAYSRGIFPWPWDATTPLLWFAPPRRGLLFFEEFSIPKRLRRSLKSAPWRVTFDTATPEVIAACASSPHRRFEGRTWIIPAMVAAYTRLAALGVCHSVEVWNGADLVGGLYGISIGGMFAGESMFFRESGASKCALVALVTALKEADCGWMDCQQVTPLLAQFGGREVSREEFQALLASAIQRPALRCFESAC